MLDGLIAMKIRLSETRGPRIWAFAEVAMILKIAILVVKSLFIDLMRVETSISSFRF